MGEIVISVLFIILSIFMFVNSYGFTSNFNRGGLGAEGFPKLIAIAMLILAVVYLLKYLKNNKKINTSIDFKKIYEEYKFVIITLLLFLIYVVSMKFVGFIISSIFYLLTSQWFLSDRSKKRIPVIIIMTLFISLGAYFFFTSYLSVTFPAGIFFE
ncbi:MAG: tripartite tricarboxylate transporter TctB family protein [Tissierellales bacterium]|nr:tripartite tricarboxylate transporter TctB family protein [Tissierellales bacterium]MBN2827923.1 tripartite tricarboxylate transporter TctB family protein [Tissierellales bacterium]